MLCCLAGGALLVALAKVARHRPRRRRPGLALLFGFSAGLFAFEALAASLIPVGLTAAPGALPVRVAVLLATGLVSLSAARAGGAGALFEERGAAQVGLASAAGAFAAELVDLHGLRLHAGEGSIGDLVLHLLPVWLLWMACTRRFHLASAAACPCEAAPDEPPVAVTVRSARENDLLPPRGHPAGPATKRRPSVNRHRHRHRHRGWQVPTPGADLTRLA